MRKIVFENVTSVTETQNGKTDLRLEGNHPNPFSEPTSLEFELSSPGSVLIVIYDNAGKHIQTLNCENCQAGKNFLQWNGMDNTNSKVQTGTYFYEVHYGNEVQSRDMILIKQEKYYENNVVARVPFGVFARSKHPTAEGGAQTEQRYRKTIQHCRHRKPFHNEKR